MKPIFYGIGWILAIILGVDRYYLGQKIKDQAAKSAKLERELNSERRQIEQMRTTYEMALRAIAESIQDENMKSRVHEKLDEIFAEARRQARIEEINDEKNESSSKL